MQKWRKSSQTQGFSPLSLSLFQRESLHLPWCPNSGVFPTFTFPEYFPHFHLNFSRGQSSFLLWCPTSTGFFHFHFSKDRVFFCPGSHINSVFPTFTFPEKEFIPTFTSTFPETEFTSALVSHLYKVFLTHGFPNDTFFPATYSIGEVVLENSGYAVNNKDQR